MSLYDKSGQSDSYNRARQTPAAFDYDFLSWMQHSISFSPLVDFTHSPLVAATFAIRRDKPYRFCNWDSAIIGIKDIGDNPLLEDSPAINDIIRNMKVICLEEKIVPFRCSGSSATSFCCDFDWILDNLKPEVFLFDRPTNDRMRKQQGLFLFFQNCLIVNSNVFGLSKTGLLIKKYVIKAGVKNNILQGLRINNPELTYSNLMNPYQEYFD